MPNVFADMKIQSNWVLWGISFLIALSISWKMINDISHSTSSTAAIGYIVIPFLFVFILLASAALIWSLFTVIDVSRGLKSVASLKACIAYGTLLFALLVTLAAFDISRLKKPGKSETELNAGMKRYSSLPILSSMAIHSVLENPNPPVTLLYQRVKDSDYYASKHPALTATLIEKLATEIPNSAWGILCNLAAHKNLSATGATLLMNKYSEGFSSEEDKKNYRDCVVSQLKFHTNTSTQVRKKAAKELGEK